MEWLQRLYILILNPIYSKTSDINEKTRTCIVSIMCFLLYALLLTWYSINMVGIYFSLSSRMIMACILLFVLIVFLGNKKLEIIKWNKLVAACWTSCGFLIFIMGFFAKQNMGYWLIGPVIALGFPCLYFVVGNNNINKFFVVFCKAAIVASLIYFIFAIFAEFFSDNVWASQRYNGTTSDANRIGEICVATCVASIYMLIVQKERIWRIMAAICMSFCICNAVLSISRSTIIAIVCLLLFSIIIIIKKAEMGNKLKDFVKYIIIISCCIIIAFGIGALIKNIHIYVQDQQIEDTEGISGLEATVPVEIKTDFSDRIYGQNTDINIFSSGRITIWSTYLSNVKLIGNAADGRTPIDESLHNVAAHNTIVEYSYRTGILAGILILLIEIVSGIYILRVLFRSKEKNCGGDYFIAFASIGYIVVSNLQVAFNPLTSIIFFVYAISLTQLFNKQDLPIDKSYGA